MAAELFMVLGGTRKGRQRQERRDGDDDCVWELKQKDSLLPLTFEQVKYSMNY
jgi:hypothetical protein